MKFLPRTLLWQLCLVLIGIQVVVAAGLGWYATLHLKEYHRDQTITELQRLTPILAERYQIARNGALRDRASLQAMVQQDTREQPGLRITVIANDGRVLADSMQDPAIMDNHSGRPEVIEALQTGRGTSVRYSSSVDAEMVYFARVYAQAETSERLILRTSLTLDEADAGLIAVQRMLAVGGLVILAVTAGLFYLVSSRVSGSVAGLAEQAATVSSAERPVRIEPPPIRELVPIATALNDISAKLHDRIEELSRRQREHEAILTSMNSGVVALDHEQRIISMNQAAARLFDLNVVSVRGRLLEEVIRHPAVHRYVKEAISDSGMSRERADRPVSASTVGPGGHVLHGSPPAGPDEHGADWTHPTELQTRSDPPTIVELTSSRLSNAAGSTTGLLLVMNNVTELRRLESIRSDFAANVSHELRTPITNIKGYLETMLEVGTADEAQVRGFLEIIKRNADRLAAIIEDILSLAWLEQPDTREGLSRQPVAVAEIVDTVISEFENAAEAKDITLRSHVPADLSVTVNQPLIEQALANYVSNAIKYSPTGTQVTIQATLNDRGEVELAVTDQGPGISPDHQRRIFERFYRVDKARSRELGGTGLGLAIVKHIALVHGGRVAVESTIGRGSTFRMILPGRAAR